jgi:hypothetical protein
MSEVGITSIALGVLIVCSRLPLWVAPAAFLGWFKRVIETNTRIRLLGLIVLAIGAGMIWGSATEHSILASILTIWGWWIVAIGTTGLLIFPGVYHAIASAVLPIKEETSLPGWRSIGILGSIVGSLLIYFGVLAL